MTFYNSDNLHNLFSYWQAMGALDLGQPFQASTGWPNRLWPTTSDFQLADAVSILAQERRPLMMPVAQPAGELCWQEALPVQVTLHQVAMECAAPKVSSNHQADGERQLVPAQTNAQLRTWVELCSAAFGYDIDIQPLQRLLRDDRATLYLLQDRGIARATAATFQTDGTLGIHQVGVPSRFRQQGLARTLMQKLMQANDPGIGKFTLQASAMGLPLYQALGFTEQFHIHSISARQ